MGSIFLCMFRASGMFGTCMHSVFYNVPFTIWVWACSWHQFTVINHFAVLLFFSIVGIPCCLHLCFCFLMLQSLCDSKFHCNLKMPCFPIFVQWFWGGQRLGRTFQMRVALCSACKFRTKCPLSWWEISLTVHVVSCLSCIQGQKAEGWHFAVQQSCWALKINCISCRISTGGKSRFS